MRGWRLALIGLSSLWLACGPDPATECTSPAECNDGEECTLDLCDQGVCKNNADDTIVPAQGSPLDCKQEVCSGGRKSQIADNTETPNDNVPCTSDSCVNGSPVFAPNDDVCGAPADCKALVCDPQGAQGTPDINGCSAITDNNNLPNDNASCTADSCANGTPVHLADNAVCLGSSGETATCVLEACDPNTVGADPVTGCAVIFDDGACDDGNFCTDDACDPNGNGANATTGCTITANVGQPIQIDGNCQLEVCFNGNPSQTPDINDVPSVDTDGFSCTVPGCNAQGQIIEIPTNNLCNDSLSCTKDTCSPAAPNTDPASGCIAEPLADQCPAGQACDPTADPVATANTGCVDADTCPPTLTALDNGAVTADTSTFINDFALSCGNNGAAHPDLAFTLDLAVDSDVIISAQSQGHGLAVALLDISGGVCGAELLCSNGDPTLAELSILNLAAGSYAIVVDGSGATLQAGTFDLTIISDPTTITAGDLLVNEVMADGGPGAALNTNGEYVEIANPSATFAVGTSGLTLTDSTATNNNIAGAGGAQIIVPPNGFIVGIHDLNPANNGGFAGDAFTITFAVNNTAGDIFKIAKGANILDIVDTTAANPNGAFPTIGADGVAFQLDPSKKTAALNDNKVNWCSTPTSTFGNVGARGTPGAANESCAPPTCTVGTQAVDCNDNQPCTDDVCVAGACQNNNDNTNTPASDGFSCTSEACVNGQTVITQNDNLCDDGVGCTLDFCTGAGGAAVTGCEVIADDTQCLANETCDIINDCQAGGPVCGNGIIEAGEECDGGATCDATCQRIPICGDGFIDAPETCDDNNTNNGDGCSSVCQAEAPILFFSEYTDPSAGNDKALEIFNPTGVAFDLGANSCNLQIFTNGSAVAGTPLALTGTVAPGDVFVACRSTASAPLLGVCEFPSASAVLNFNGDDALALVCGTTTLDIIGQIGFDPGVEWSAGGDLSTADNTIRRKCSVTSGDTNGTNDFNLDLAAQWVGFPAGTIAGFGDPACAP
jgi:cysteine-rich repeat protein